MIAPRVRARGVCATDDHLIDHEAVQAIRRQLQGADARLGYIVRLTRDAVRDRSRVATQLFTSAGRLIGRNTDQTRGFVSTISRKGGVEAYRAWLDEPPALPHPSFAPMPFHEVGEVYTARVVEHPHVLKIGFSRAPLERMESLGQLFGVKFKLTSIFPGTRLDEARRHYDAGRLLISREFVFDPAYGKTKTTDIPDFLLGAFASSHARAA